MSASLGGRTWPEVDRPTAVFVPLGSTEQHGPHLPLSTDAVIAERVAEALASHPACWPGTTKLVAPIMPYGASGEHQAFPGTVSIGHDALRLLLVELIRSLSQWAGRIIIVNAHGGNTPTVRSAVEQMRTEGHAVCAVNCEPPDPIDAHAGHVETSLMLHLAPELVSERLAVVGNCSPLQAILPAMLTSGVRAVSDTGVLGDATTASADAGRELFDSMVSRALMGLDDA
jgi:mycofactocin system creatininase family protein